MRPILALLFLCAACPGPPAQPDAIPAFDCGDALAMELRVPGGGYLPIADAADAELVLGFQGFRYVYVRARLEEDPGVISATARVELDGGSPRSQPIGQLAFAADDPGVVSDPVQVFFNDDPLPSLVDHGVALELRLGDQCADAGHAVLRYDDTCVEGPEGQPICEGGPDGGP